MHPCPAGTAARVLVALARAAFFCIVGATLAGCSGGILEPQGPTGAANVTILLNALTIMGVVVIPTLAAILCFAWWFRASNTRAVYQPNFVYSGQLELLVWAIPSLVILFLGDLIWVGSYELDPYRPIQSQVKPLQLRVIALDWKWLFIYPDQGIASVNEVIVPAGNPVQFQLTSASVMNAFFVPQLGSMIATMHRMVTQLNLQADRPGDYFGQSTQFSGDGFPTMHFVLRAVPPDAFDAWLADARASKSALDRTEYLALAKPSQGAAPFIYGTVEPGLFEAVASQEIPPAPGPANAVGPERAEPPQPGAR